MSEPDRRYVADEKTTLGAFLDAYRATLVRKAAGLTDEQARWSPVPSGTSLFGLLSHLTYAERWWFSKIVAGLDVELPWTDDGHPDVDWHGAPGATLADVVAAYEQECARSREVYAAADLDTVLTGEEAGRSVRWVVVHMVEETARHAGHADVIRELVDGSTGH